MLKYIELKKNEKELQLTFSGAQHYPEALPKSRQQILKFLSMSMIYKDILTN